LSGQYIKIFATGLPLPEYRSTTFDCKTGQTTREDHNWTLALDFGPNTYWVFEKGFILNNEFDLAWSMQLYLPFAYWYNHQDPTSPTWNGSLYWKDYNGNFHTGSQFLKVPVLFPGNYTISLYEFNRQTDTDEKAYLATTDFTVLKDPLYVRASSGTLYFSGEKVTAYAEVDLDGMATNPTAITFQLYHEDAFLMSLSTVQVSDAEGLYTATFTCPPQEGNYFIKVTASKTLGTDITLSGFGVTGFVVNPTLEGLNATLTTMNNGLATVNTNLGTITLDLSEIRGNITAINGKLATLNTTVGSISTDISTINGKIVSLNDNIATIQTTVGTFKTSLDSIGATVTATGADTVTIKTAVGDIQGKITSIDGKTTNIETSIGQVSTSTESIKTQTGLQPAGIGLSLVGALAAIIAAVLIFRKLYK
jgi:prefoldin subunit 5